MRPREPLSEYRRKRDFTRTPEPQPATSPQQGGHLFTIQKHAARRLHYDLRLELNGVLKSWAITKEPGLDAGEKRLAVETEDHPLDYARFEGDIPPGNYGAGHVELWDEGEWIAESDPDTALEKGKLDFRLNGHRLKGRFTLVRMKPRPKERQPQWLFIKRHDGEAEPLPDPSAFLPLQLATLADAVPQGGAYVHEIKFDGYRMLALIENGHARCITRNGLDWTERFGRLVPQLESLPVSTAVLDGEVIAGGAGGKPEFSALQEALKTGGALTYYVFDLLWLNGRDMRRENLLKRKEALAAILPPQTSIRFSEHVEGDGERMRQALCADGFEGVVSKKADAPYEPGRGKSWIKVKCRQQQEFIVGGYTPSTRKKGFASLLLGLREGNLLRFAGRVGTGFNEARSAELQQALDSRASPQNPFADAPREITRNAVWARPELVAEVAFAEFTAQGVVRQASFIGLREDKEPQSIVREIPKHLFTPKDSYAGVRLTNPAREFYPGTGITKARLAAYYEAVSPAMLPLCRERPLSLLRCPEGEGAECFYQKHHTGRLPAAMERIRIKEKSATREYVFVKDAGGLVACAQMGVLEIHPWGAFTRDIERPERLIIDLDPAPDVPFTRVKEAAFALRMLIEELGLAAYALITGGKGVHVIVPLRTSVDWPQAAAASRRMAEILESAAPASFTLSMSKARRAGRIFVDTFRNARGATAICPYSTRAKPGAPVAAPVSWKELESLTRADAFSLEDAELRAARHDDIWPDYQKNRRALTRTILKKLGA